MTFYLATAIDPVDVRVGDRLRITQTSRNPEGVLVTRTDVYEGVARYVDSNVVLFDATKTTGFFLRSRNQREIKLERLDDPYRRLIDIFTPTRGTTLADAVSSGQGLALSIIATRDLDQLLKALSDSRQVTP